MSGTLLSIAYPFAPVGPCAVGGAEQVLTELEAALTKRGNRSIVVAREGSEVTGRLLGTAIPSGRITEALRREAERAHQANIDLAFASYSVDLVHMHGVDFHRYHIPAHVPVLVTLHLPPAWYPDAIWHLSPDYHLQCVSKVQQCDCPAGARSRISVVENGVRLPNLGVRRKLRYALMLSRICPEKNLHLGLDAARLASMPVILAGQVFPYNEHVCYFEREIQSRLGSSVHFIGRVGKGYKQRLLARAACLLLPTLAPETSSLVAMEALAAGTPVIALPSGAIAGIVEDGRTGFLVNDLAGMAEAIGRIYEIDPEECRAAAESRFALARMLEGYWALYRKFGMDPDPAVANSGSYGASCTQRNPNVPARS